MVTKIINNKTGDMLFQSTGHVPGEMGSRIFIAMDDKQAEMFQIVASIPLYRAERNNDEEYRGHSEERFVFVEPLENKIDPVKAAPGYTPTEGGFYDKYIVAKSDGSPIKNGAEYLVLNIAHDPAAQQAAHVYCDAQREPRFAEFVQGLRLKLQQLRNKGLTRHKQSL